VFDEATVTHATLLPLFSAGPARLNRITN